MPTQPAYTFGTRIPASVAIVRPRMKAALEVDA
jgi:hypothetical protein